MPVSQNSGASITAPRMSDIADKLEPEVQAALLEALRAVQAVSVRLAAALEKRADLMAALAAEKAGWTNEPGA